MLLLLLFILKTFVVFCILSPVFDANRFIFVCICCELDDKRAMSSAKSKSSCLVVTLHLVPVLLPSVVFLIIQSTTRKNIKPDSNSDGYQNIESDHWDFEGTVGDKMSAGNAFAGIMEPNSFEPCARD